MRLTAIFASILVVMQHLKLINTLIIFGISWYLTDTIVQSAGGSDSSNKFDWKSFLRNPEGSGEGSVLHNDSSLTPHHTASLADSATSSMSLPSAYQPVSQENQSHRGESGPSQHTEVRREGRENFAESEQERYLRLKRNTQRKYSAKVRSFSGYSSHLSARLGHARLAKMLGVMTKEQRELLEKETDRQIEYRKRKKVQRTKDGVADKRKISRKKKIPSDS